MFDVFKPLERQKERVINFKDDIDMKNVKAKISRDFSTIIVDANSTEKYMLKEKTEFDQYG